MKLPNREPHSSPAAIHPLISPKGCWTGLHVEPLAVAAERSRVHPHPDLPSWSLTFGEDGVRHQRLTSQEAQRMMAEVRANALPAADADGNSWWSSIGDFLKALVGKFVDAVLDFAKLIVDGTKAVFKFVMKGVQYVFEKAVTVVQDAFDMLELILAAVYDTVVDFFERTFEWIGFLFDWPDILRTRTAIAHIIDQTFVFLEGAGPGLRRKIDPVFPEARKKITDAFNLAIAKFDSAASLEFFAKDNDHHNPKLAYAAGNNVVSNALMNNCQQAKPTRSTLAAMELTTVNTRALDDALGDWAARAKQKPAFGNTETFFESSSSADGFFEKGMKALLETLRDLILAAVDGAQAAIDALLDKLTELATQLRKAAKYTYTIPLVSELYEKIASAPLTALDLAALMAAIPATIFYKAVYGAAPFPSDSSVDEFKRNFTGQWLLDASGLGTNLTERSVGELSAWEQRQAQCACIGFTAIYGAFSAFL